MTAASGGTAIDVLRNIPQVEVDGTNKVSLRGNQNVVVQINGRSTPLKGEQLGTFLSQMPANTVKTVEVAANPSAKDDPEGTAGIINIVLNQEAEIGLRGGVNVGTGTTGQVNASGNVGKQQGHVTGFMSLFGYRDSRASSRTISRTNLRTRVPALVETSMSGRQRPWWGGGSFRGEYRFNDRDALTFDSYPSAGHYGGRNATYYTDLDTVRNMIGAFNQLNDNDSHNLSQDYDVAFRRQGKPTTPQLTAEIEYANNTNNTDVNLSGLVTKPDVSTPSIIPTERDHTVGRYPYVNAKLDFTYPVNPATKFETGGKYADRNTGNDFTAAYLNAATGAFDVNPARNTSFTYREHIGGAYALLSRQLGKFQTQGGVRLEHANHRQRSQSQLPERSVDDGRRGQRVSLFERRHQPCDESVDEYVLVVPAGERHVQAVEHRRRADVLVLSRADEDGGWVAAGVGESQCRHPIQGLVRPG